MQVRSGATTASTVPPPTRPLYRYAGQLRATTACTVPPPTRPLYRYAGQLRGHYSQYSPTAYQTTVQICRSARATKGSTVPPATRPPYRYAGQISASATSAILSPTRSMYRITISLMLVQAAHLHSFEPFVHTCWYDRC